MTLTLRPYQQEAVDAIFREFETHDSTLLVLPTGGGKTLCFAKVAEQFRPQGRILVIAHREELLIQADNKIKQWTNLRTGIEQADRSVAGMFLPDVTIASIQTLSRPSRMEQFARDIFGLVIVDEVHHVCSPTYLSVIQYFDSAKLLGVTATPERLDKKALGAVFESVAYTVDIRDLIEQKYLVDIRQQAVEVRGLDLSKVRTTAGDLNEADLEKILMEERNLHEVAQPTVELAGDRPTLVFGTTIAHAKALTDVLNRYAERPAKSIDGTMERSERADILEAFTNGDVQFLTNCMIVTEGVDIPPISCVSMARPTKSKSLYSQMLGRGTRLYPGKEDLLILDFVGNSGKHSLISALDIMDGTTDLEVKARAQSLSKKNPQLTILEALEQATEELANEKRTSVLAKARFNTIEIDPFDALGVRPRAGRWGGAPMTDKQISILDKNGIPWKDLDRGQASQVIDKICARREKGLCTLKQAKQLMRFGIQPDVTFEQASQIMNALAQASWRPTLAQMESIRRIAA